MGVGIVYSITLREEIKAIHALTVKHVVLNEHLAREWRRTSAEMDCRITSVEEVILDYIFRVFEIVPDLNPDS